MPSHPLLRIARRKNVLAGLMFIGIAGFGLWASRHYPVGTAVRMSTGYVPRLLCWVLMGLGTLVLLQGLRETDPIEPHGEAEVSAATRLRPIVAIPAALVAFAFTLEPLGLVLASLLMIAVASFATRELKPWETAAATVGLIMLSVAIFILGLGLPIPLWPDW